MAAKPLGAEQLTTALKTEARRLGFDLAGVAPAVEPPSLEHFHRWLAEGCAGKMHYLARRARAYTHPHHVLPGVRSVLVLAVNYRTAEPVEPGPGQARVSRYAWGEDYHRVLRRRLKRLARFHQQLTPAADVRAVVDTAPILEREFARLAGLGRIGKNTTLIHDRFGSWLFLAALLTTAELVCDEPLSGDPCEGCNACLEACPGAALTGPYRLDARRCISYLTVEHRGPIPPEQRARLGVRVFGCDTCQEVCPHNRHTPPSSEAAFAPLAGLNPASPAEWLQAPADKLRERFARSPLRRAGRAGLLRSAAVVLGNRADVRAIGALAEGLNDQEPLVRRACAWALGRCGGSKAREALEQRLCSEPDAEARAELDAALARHGL